MASRFVSVTFPEQTAKQIIPVKQDNSTVLWVVNFNKGWVMLSGDTRAPIILAENSLGSYNPQYDNNPARTAWIEGYKQIVLDVRNGKRIPGEESEAVWRICSPEKRQRPFTKSIDDPVWVRSTISSSMTYVSSSNFVPHLISTKWGQGAPWNSNVPYYYDNNSSLHRFPVGCTAVAIGQILYYFHETYNVPTGLYETVNNSHYLPLGGYNIFFSHSNFVTQSSRWEDMPVDSTSLGYPEYVSDLLGDIGHSVNMDYGITGSGAWPNPDVMNDYGLTCSNRSPYYATTVLDEIISGYPVILVAYCSDGGHTFIADGRISKSYYYQICYEWHHYPSLDYVDEHNIPCEFYLTDDEMDSYDPFMYEGKNTYEYSSPTYHYLFMNWGWDGKDDSSEYNSFYGDWQTTNYCFGNGLSRYMYSGIRVL